MPANPTPSRDAPPSAYHPLVAGLLVRQSQVSSEGATPIVQQWQWLIGPHQTTAEFSFPYPVYFTVIAGGAQISRTPEKGESASQSLRGGTSLAIAAGTRLVIANSEEQQVDIRAFYFTDGGS